MSPPWWLIEQSDLGDRLIGERTIASAESPLCLSTGAPATAPPARSTGSFLVIHPCVSRPHSKHSRYSRSGARRIQSSWPMNQHFNDSRSEPAKLVCAEGNLYDMLGVDLGSGFEILEPCPEYQRR